MATSPAAGAPTDRSDDEAFKYRLDFVEHCFTNAQELTRLMDQKATNILGVVGIFTGAIGILVTYAKPLDFELSGMNAWRFGVAGVMGLVLVAYLVVAFLVVRSATEVYVAQPSRADVQTSAPGLIFPLMVISQFNGDERLYAQRLATLTPADILLDYANQVMEVSAIYQDKQGHVNRASAQVRTLVLSWTLATVLLLAFPALIRLH
jgi:hypothetical protein